MSLYILDANPVSGIWFASIFSLSVASLFILLQQSFAEQKFLISTKSSGSVFHFMECAFGVKSKKSFSYFFF